MRNLFFSSLRNSLVTLVLLSVLPALGVILHSSLENRDRAIHDAKAESMRVAQFLASEQQLITLRAEQLLTLLAEMPQVKSLDGPATSAILRRLRSHSSLFANIIAADAHGRVFASALALDKPTTLKSGRHFTQSLENGEFTVGDFDLGLPGTPAVPLIHYAYPITDKDGQNVGVLSTALRPDRYERIFNVASLPPGSVLSIADQKGTRIYRYPLAENTSPAGKRVVAELWNVISGKETLGTATVPLADGVRRIVAFKQLRLRPDLPPYLYISVGIPEDQALAKAIDTLYRDLLTLAGAATLAILVAWIVGGIVISRPVERLAQVAKRLGGGDLDARSGAPEEFGELSLLAKTLDDMAEALSEDITAREAAEVDLRKSEALLRMILDALPVGVWMSDAKGSIRYVNLASRTIWGLGERQTPDLGDGFRAWRHDSGESVTPNDFVLARALDERAPSSGALTQVLEIEGAAGGARIVVQCSGISIRDDEGKIRAAIIVLEDITERLHREQARESVEHIMRHDLRSPLIGFASLPQLLLRQPNLTEEQRGWVSRLQHSANSMLRILDAYLKLSRIERGTLAFEPAQTDFVALLNEVKDSLEHMPQFNNQHVLLTIEGKQLDAARTLPLLCEETLCATMLMNLLKNALEASPEGGLVEVDLHDAPDSISLSIRNSGEVPLGIRQRFFEKYVTSAKKNGTGLGTYSARRIAKFHGGSVRLENDVPGQTTVKVILPKTQPRTA